MKFFSKGAMLVAAVGTIAALAYAQGSVTLRLKPPVGAKYQYKVTMNTTAGSGGAGAGANLNGSFNQWYIVKSKNAKGTTIQTKVTNAKISGGQGVNGKQIADAMEKQTITALYSPLGAYVSGDLNMGQMGAMAAQAGVQGIIFPQGPVKAGSTWTATIDIGKIMAATGAQGMKVVSGGKIPVKYKITGFKKVGTKNVAGVSASMNGNVVMAMGETKMTLAMKSTSTGQVDVATGIVRSMASTANVGTSFGQMKMNQTIKMSMTLL
jgi:hypothetical protein